MNEIETKEYYDFVNSNSNTHFMQSSEWARVKGNWKNEVILVRDDSGKIAGCMSVLIQKIPVLNYSMLYCPRGPVCDADDKIVFGKLMDSLKELAKREKAFIFRMDPAIPNSNEEFRNLARENGISLKSNINHDINKVIQPKYEMQLNIKGKTEDELLASFSQKTRYNIRLAAKKGVTIEEGTEDDIDEFFSILTETSQRDQFTIRNVSYYKKVYEIMKEKDHVKLYFARFNDKRIATTLEIIYGNKAWYLYGGSLREHSNVMPNYLLQWTMIKEAMKRGCEFYNFGGVSGYIDEHASGYGVFRFKKGFNPEFIEYVDELDIVFKPFINTLFNIANKVRRLLRRKNN